MQLDTILTPNELRVNIEHVKQMMMNREMVLEYTEPVSKKVRTIEQIRVRIFNRHVEVKSQFDRDWRPIDLKDIVVQ
jgi:hypothetical protein